MATGIGHSKGRTVVKNNFWKYICMSNPKNDKIVIKRESSIACGLVKIPILEHPLGKKGRSYPSVLDYSMLVQDAITAIASHGGRLD
jgi:hypothetical protein